jgi:hypothetical protein
MPTHCFDEHQLTQASENALAACALIGGLADGEPHELAEPAVFGPAAVADYHDVRQRCN